MLSHDVDLAELPVRLSDWFRGRMPQAEEVAVSDVVRSGAGFSNVSIAFRLSWREAGESRSSDLLLRGEVRSNPVYPDSVEGGLAVKLACQRGVFSVLVGASRTEEVEQTAQAADWKLTPEEMAEVSAITDCTLSLPPVPKVLE